MSIHYFVVLLFIFPSLLTAAPEIRVMEEPKSLEDFEHQFKGCPANSECDQVMGHQMQNWQSLVKRLMASESSPSSKKVAEVEEFREKSGIPAEFYTTKKSQQGFRPLFFHSPCKDHNPKNEIERTLRGTAFIKSITKDKAIVWRDQAQIEVPLGDLLTPQPVTVFTTTGAENFYIPIDDQPLFIKDKSLHILKEDEGFFYVLKINPKGEWKIVDIDLTRLSEWEDKRGYVECPAEKDKKTPKQFGAIFCKTIWDEDSKKPVVVRMHAGCNG
jgi:hypothetical protein